VRLLQLALDEADDEALLDEEAASPPLPPAPPADEDEDAGLPPTPLLSPTDPPSPESI